MLFSAAVSPHTLQRPTGLRVVCAAWGAGRELTVVVLTRPPGCVQVQPDLLTSRSQPSSSKHGTISHHCFFRTIPAAEKTEKEKKSHWRSKKNGRIEQIKKSDRGWCTDVTIRIEGAGRGTADGIRQIWAKRENEKNVEIHLNGVKTMGRCRGADWKTDEECR